MTIKNPSEARAAGFAIDTTVYPWVAHKSPRFREGVCEYYEVYTDREEALRAALTTLLKECRVAEEVLAL